MNAPFNPWMTAQGYGPWPYYGNNMYNPQPPSVTQAVPQTVMPNQTTPVYTQQPQAQPQKRPYYPPNWISSEKELDDFEVQAGSPLFAFVRDEEGKERLVVRSVGDDGRPHDETIPLSFPRDEKITRQDLAAYVTADDFRAVIGEIRKLNARVDELTEPAPKKRSRTASATWEEDDDRVSV